MHKSPIVQALVAVQRADGSVEMVAFAAITAHTGTPRRRSLLHRRTLRHRTPALPRSIDDHYRDAKAIGA